MPSILSKLNLSLPTLFILTFFSSCNQEKAEQQKRKSVTIYTSLDRPHSEPILKKFEEATGIEVKAVYDTEASKTIGLINRLYAEKENPKADVFWNSEVLRTIQLFIRFYFSDLRAKRFGKP